ncbi:MAG: ATP-binding protein [Chloroflexaceae bacterium]|nr:ATP-binding protein [Chloroflexaceae bacterium]
MHIYRTIPATLEAISHMSQDIEADLQYLPADKRGKVVLALHELLVNIAVHAYGGAGGAIDIVLTHTAATLGIVVTDAAATTFTMPTVIRALNPQDLPEHGMGLYIMHQTFDTVRYERLAQGNRWHLTTAVSAGGEGELAGSGC